MTGWEIRQALRVILSHPDTTIETGLAWLEPGELSRLSGVLRRTEQAMQARADHSAHRIREAG